MMVQLKNAREGLGRDTRDEGLFVKYPMEVIVEDSGR